MCSPSSLIRTLPITSCGDPRAFAVLGIERRAL